MYVYVEAIGEKFTENNFCSKVEEIKTRVLRFALLFYLTRHENVENLDYNIRDSVAEAAAAKNVNSNECKSNELYNRLNEVL